MFRFPWSNFHELNLDWILEVVKEAKEIFVNGRGDINNAVETANEALEVAEQAAAAVIADGAITIPKLNNEVLKTTAYVIVGNRADEAVPAGAYVYLRNSLVSGLSDGIYTAAANIPAGAIVTPAEFQQSTALHDSGALNVLKNTLTQDEAGLAIPKTGPTANTAIGAGKYIHLTESGNNNLPDGFYQVKSGGISQGETYTTNNLTTLSAVNGSLNYIGSSVNAITPGSNSITVSAGGYIKIGKLVFLGVRIEISSAIATNDVIFTGIPSNAGSFIPYFQMSDGYDFAHYSCRLNAGKMYANSSIPSGINLNVQGVYISD